MPVLVAQSGAAAVLGTLVSGDAIIFSPHQTHYGFNMQAQCQADI
jgi:hypothetical protein